LQRTAIGDADRKAEEKFGLARSGRVAHWGAMARLGHRTQPGALVSADSLRLFRGLLCRLMTGGDVQFPLGDFPAREKVLPPEQPKGFL